MGSILDTLLGKLQPPATSSPAGDTRVITPGSAVLASALGQIGLKLGFPFDMGDVVRATIQTAPLGRAYFRNFRFATFVPALATVMLKLDVESSYIACQITPWKVIPNFHDPDMTVFVKADEKYDITPAAFPLSVDGIIGFGERWAQTDNISLTYTNGTGVDALVTLDAELALFERDFYFRMIKPLADLNWAIHAGLLGGVGQ